MILAIVALLPSIAAVRQHHEESAASTLESLGKQILWDGQLITPEEYEQKLANFTADWKQHGLEVKIYQNITDVLNAPEYKDLPWKTTLDKAVDVNNMEDRPICSHGSCSEVKLDEVLPYLKHHPEHAYLYHGGDIKTEYFQDGIDFTKGSDQITGPAFFTTHNLYHALVYGAKGLASWLNKNAKIFIYRLALEIEIQHLDQCKGLVADMEFLEKAAAVGQNHVTQWVESQCGGKKCSFIAVNWNKDGKLGSGNVPYEFRLLPGSVETCGLKFHRILMVKSFMDDPFFRGVMRDAGVNAAFAEFLRLKAISKGETAEPAW